MTLINPVYLLLFMGRRSGGFNSNIVRRKHLIYCLNSYRKKIKQNKVGIASVLKCTTIFFSNIIKHKMLAGFSSFLILFI